MPARECPRWCWSRGEDQTYGSLISAAGATLREHSPFACYAYVLAGTLRVTNTQTGHRNVYEAGDFIIQAIGQWHQAVNLDDRPLKLLVIDQQTGLKSNVVMRN